MFKEEKKRDEEGRRRRTPIAHSPNATSESRFRLILIKEPLRRSARRYSPRMFDRARRRTAKYIWRSRAPPRRERIELTRQFVRANPSIHRSPSLPHLAAPLRG